MKANDGAGGAILTHALPGWKPDAFLFGDACLRMVQGMGSNPGPREHETAARPQMLRSVWRGRFLLFERWTGFMLTGSVGYGLRTLVITDA